MRTVFLGTSDFAAAVLRRLADSPHRPALVVTRPDAPRGRGRRLQPPPAALIAAELGIDTIQPERLNDEATRARISAAEPGAVCVCAYGALIREPLLSEHRMLNVHPSLLPRWRGAAPVERAIMAGDAETGVSIMVVTAGLDSGPVCLQAREPIRADDDYGSLAVRLQTLGGELLARALDTDPPCEEQSEEGATYAEKIVAEDRRLDPQRPATELALRVRGLTPHIGAWVELPPDGERLGVTRADAVEAPGLQAGGLNLDGPAPVLGCAEGGLELLAVTPPGRRTMSGQDWLRGHRR